MFRQIKTVMLAAVVMATMGANLSLADNVYQGFETWGRKYYTNPYAPNTNLQWVINDVRIYGGGGWLANTNVDPLSTNTSFLYPFSSASTYKSTNSWLQTPGLSNGLGNISYWYRNNGAGTCYFSLQYSYDGSNWTSAVDKSCSV